MRGGWVFHGIVSMVRFKAVKKWMLILERRHPKS